MMRSTEMSMDDQIRSIHHKYQIPEDEAKEILSRGFRFNDVDKAALLSCLSGKTAGEILDMRKDDPWGRIEKKLGLTPEIYSKRYIAHRAKSMKWAPYVQQEFGISEETFKSWIAETRNPSLKKR